jgi:hypothetical protein
MVLRLQNPTLRLLVRLKKLTRQPGDFGPAGEGAPSPEWASRIDAETIATIIELIDRSMGVSSGLQEATSPSNGEDVIENKGGPEQEPGIITYSTVPYPELKKDGTIVLNTLPHQTERSLLYLSIPFLVLLYK